MRFRPCLEQFEDRVTPSLPPGPLGTTTLYEPASSSTFGPVGDSVIVAASGPWTATVASDPTSAAMLAITGTIPTPSGGNGLVTFTIAPNTTPNIRVGHLIIDGADLAIYQAGSTFSPLVPVGGTLPLKVGNLSIGPPLNGPTGVALDNQGNLFIADTNNNRILEQNITSGTVSDLGIRGLIHPEGVAVDGQGNVFIADTNNNQVLERNVNGTITTLIANFPIPTPVGGSATPGVLTPAGVAVDRFGDVFIADTGNSRILEWNATTKSITQVITVVPGVTGVAVDEAGNIYEADTAGGGKVQEWVFTAGAYIPGPITLVAGATSVAVDGEANVYFGLSGGGPIYEWNPTTFFGPVVLVPPPNPLLPLHVGGLAVDSQGDLFIADTGDNAILERPIGYVDTTPITVGPAAGQGVLPVLTSANSLTGVFAPQSNAPSWLGITPPPNTFSFIAPGVVNGINYFYLANGDGSRTTTITVLDPLIPVTQTAAPPVVTLSTAPLPANAATLIINGSGFDTTAANDSVTFTTILANGQPGPVVTGSVTNASQTSLTVSLTGLTSLTAGTLLDASVQVDSGTPSSSVQVATIAPVITPSTAPVTTNSMTIYGFGFDLTRTNDNVTFYSNGVVIGGPVQPTAVTTTSLTVGVPGGLTAGTELDALVTVDGVRSVGAPVQVAIIAATIPIVPTVTNPTATSLMATSAVLGGTVSSTGGAPITQRGVLYAPTASDPNPTLNDGKAQVVFDPVNSLGAFSESVTGLSPGIQYSFVAFAGNSVGTAYTSVSIFTLPAASTFQIISTTVLPGDNGFLLTFDAPYKLNTGSNGFNLYTGDAGNTLNPSRAVQITGPGGASFGIPNVSDTVRFNAVPVSSTQLELIETGIVNTAAPKLLATGLWNVTVAGGTNNPGVVQLSNGNNLDGNGNGTVQPTDNYTANVTATAPFATTVVVTIGDVIGGPGQTVTAPLVVSRNVSDVTSVDFQFPTNNPNFTVTSVAFTTAIPGGSGLFNPVTGIGTFSSPNPFASNDSSPVLIATVSFQIPGLGNPGTAPPIGSKTPTGLTATAGNALLQPKTSVTVDGFQTTAYLGDVSAPWANYSGADYQAIQKLIVGQVSAFAEYKDLDPNLIADATRDGQVTGVDVTAVQKTVLGLPSSLPALPVGAASSIVVGPDPRVYIDVSGIGSVSPGQTGITVPIKITNTSNAPITVSSADFAVKFDPAVLSFQGITLGNVANGSGTVPVGVSSLASWSSLSNVVNGNTILMTGAAANGPQLAAGQTGVIFNITFNVLAGAASGATTLNMLDDNTFTILSDNNLNTLSLVPAVSDGVVLRANGGEDDQVNVQSGSVPTPSKLVFGVQPGTTTAGNAINPAVTVKIVDPNGNVITSDNTDQVTLGIASGPTGGGFAAGSTTTVTAVAGVATFSNLIFTTAGTYTLSESTGTTSTNPNLSGPVSSSFTINSTAPVSTGVRVYIDTSGISSASPGQTGITVPIKIINNSNAPITVSSADFAVQFDPTVLSFQSISLGDVANSNDTVPPGVSSLSPWSYLWNVVNVNTILMTGAAANGPLLAAGQTGVIYFVQFNVLPSAAKGQTILNMLSDNGFTILSDNNLNTLSLSPPVSDGVVLRANGGEDDQLNVQSRVSPVITVQPIDQTVIEGQTVTFTAACSDPAATVQWQVCPNGSSSFTPIAGATSTTLTFTATKAQNGNQYQAVFTNTIGQATSRAAVLTVAQAPSITTQPTNQTVTAGQTVTFTAAASGNPAPTVQWQVSTDGGNTFTSIVGATSSTLTFTATAAQNANEYQAVFTNSVANVVTSTALLTVNWAPVITVQPISQTVTAGQTVTFTAAASSNPAATVQWQVCPNGGSRYTPIAGATSNTLSFTATAAQNGNKYQAVFTNSLGQAPSSAATLTVCQAPVITTQPNSQTVTAGQTVTFTAAASGNPTPTVQWQVSTDGGSTFSNIPGATLTTLTFTATAAQNANEYQAVFTNSIANVVTSAATLTVNWAPAITIQPTSQMVTAGQPVTFTAAASSNPSATVQWQVCPNGSSSFATIAGATSTTLTFTAVASQNGGKYRAVFTNNLGPAPSNAAILTVCQAPVVTTQPTSRTVNAGQTVTFTAAASGNPTPTVQWQVSTDGGSTFSNIPGATLTTLTFTATTAQNTSDYRAVFTNSVGQATTQAATLTVLWAPVITIQPASQTITAGQMATFTAAASSNPTATVQWQVCPNGGSRYTPIAGATSNTLSFTATAAQNGNKYQAVFTNSLGQAISSAATLMVCQAPVITTQPNSRKVNASQPVSFTAAASANPPATVQWQVSTDGGSTFSNIAGATSPTWTFTATAAQNTSAYRAVFSNSVGQATTQAATLTVLWAPVITIQPASQPVMAGQTVTFTAAASSNPAATVQWQFCPNGGNSFSNIAGATSTTLTFTAAAAQNGSKYQAVFNNSLGRATTSAATLTVCQVPVITTQPTSRTANAGQAVTFTAAASGNPAATVQWQVSTDGGSTFSNIAGAISPTWTFTATAAQNTSAYRAVFSNSVGQATTQAATLTVLWAPVITIQPASQTITAGQMVTFTAAASSNPSATVQWQFCPNGGNSFSNIAGATSASLTFTAALAQNGNKYQAVFTNSLGKATSNAAILTVVQAPIITTQPTNRTVTAGQNVTFTAAASSNPAATVQWQVSTDGGNTFTSIAGATLATLTFTATAAQNGNRYQAVFTNSLGQAISNAATLTVNQVNQAPAFTSPSQATFIQGANNSFTVTATGFPVVALSVFNTPLPRGLTFTDNHNNTATLSGTPAAGSSGIYVLTFLAQNSLGHVMQVFTLMIN